MIINLRRQMTIQSVRTNVVRSPWKGMTMCLPLLLPDLESKKRCRIRGTGCMSINLCTSTERRLRKLRRAKGNTQLICKSLTPLVEHERMNAVALEIPLNNPSSHYEHNIGSLKNTAECRDMCACSTTTCCVQYACFRICELDYLQRHRHQPRWLVRSRKDHRHWLLGRLCGQ